MQSVVSEQRLANLQRWREARKWIKKQNALPVTSVYEASYKEGGSTIRTKKL